MTKCLRRRCAGWGALEIDAVPWEQTSLIALGRLAFFRYPVQLAANVAGNGLGRAATHFGFWVHDRALGGTMWTRPRRVAAPCGDLRDLPQLGRGRRARRGAQQPRPRSRKAGIRSVSRCDRSRPCRISAGATRRHQRRDRQPHGDRGSSSRGPLAGQLAPRRDTRERPPPSRGAHRDPHHHFALRSCASTAQARICPRPLPFPARAAKIRVPDDAARRGQPLFAAQCARCHVPPRSAARPCLSR